MASHPVLAAVLLLLLGAFDVAVGRFVVKKGSVSVVSPEHIRGHHDGAVANFAVPNDSASMVGVVVYPNAGANGCRAFDRRFKSQSSSLPIVLLLDRGECYLTEKAWHGQSAGAAAVLIADKVDEPLVTMGSPEASGDGYGPKITIPYALFNRSFGESLKKAARNAGGDPVVVKLDWMESTPRPDVQVKYEFWTSSNDECGVHCDERTAFVRDFRAHAQMLEMGGYTLFTPHYIIWFCPEAFVFSKQCKSQCINRGRYCAPDPELDFNEGYEGKDVVVENLRQLCTHRVANESGRPWVWWDFVTDFHARCSMKEKRYSRACGEEVVRSLGLPVDKIKECMGDPDADVENNVLKTEQDVQGGRGSQGNVTVSTTLVINNVQYRGKLNRTAVLKAICAGFNESTKPPVCLNADI